MESLNKSKDDKICFNTLFQWECKAMEMYGVDKVKGFFEYFLIYLSEEYNISFTKPFEVQIEIAMDLKDIAKRLYQIEDEQKEWIQKEVESTIQVLKIDLKKLLTIIRRSKRTNKISVFFKSWTEETPAIIIYEKTKGDTNGNNIL